MDQHPIQGILYNQVHKFQKEAGQGIVMSEPLWAKMIERMWYPNHLMPWEQG
jgi:hypothetical protein